MRNYDNEAQAEGEAINKLPKPKLKGKPSNVQVKNFLKTKSTPTINWVKEKEKEKEHKQMCIVVFTIIGV